MKQKVGTFNGSRTLKQVVSELVEKTNQNIREGKLQGKLLGQGDKFYVVLYQRSSENPLEGKLFPKVGPIKYEIIPIQDSIKPVTYQIVYEAIKDYNEKKLYELAGLPENESLTVLVKIEDDLIEKDLTEKKKPSSSDTQFITREQQEEIKRRLRQKYQLNG